MQCDPFLNCRVSARGELLERRWQFSAGLVGDTDASGVVNLSDLLDWEIDYSDYKALSKDKGFLKSIETNYDRPEQFRTDLAYVLSLSGYDPEYESIQETNGQMLGDRLVVRLSPTYNQEQPQQLRTRITRGGKLRVYARLWQSSYESLVIEVKPWEVKSVYVVDSGGKHAVKLDASFPAASIFMRGGHDLVIANDQPNTIYGGSGDDTIFAAGGDDLVYAGEGVNRVFGEGGDDTLLGGAKRDFIDGGSGRNRLIGGAGIDTFTIRSTKNKVVDLESIDYLKRIT